MAPRRTCLTPARASDAATEPTTSPPAPGPPRVRGACLDVAADQAADQAADERRGGRCRRASARSRGSAGCRGRVRGCAAAVHDRTACLRPGQGLGGCLGRQRELDVVRFRAGGSQAEITGVSFREQGGCGHTPALPWRTAVRAVPGNSPGGKSRPVPGAHGRRGCPGPAAPRVVQPPPAGSGDPHRVPCRGRPGRVVPGYRSSRSADPHRSQEASRSGGAGSAGQAWTRYHSVISSGASSGAVSRPRAWTRTR